MPDIYRVKGDSKRFAKVRQAKEGDVIDLRVALSASGETVDVYIYDVIGWPFVIAADLLYQIPPNAKTINVHLNTPGGDIFEGIAIYNMLSAHPGEVKVYVDGLAASAGSLIAMAGNTITMRPATFLMIHNGWSSIAGDADDLRKEADLLDKINLQFADVYAGKSGKKRDEILAMMDAETWFTADEAISARFADAIASPEKSLPDTAPKARFDLSVFANAPEALRAACAGQKNNNNQNHNMEVYPMNEKLKSLLVRFGLKSDATDEQANAFLADLDITKIETPEEKAMVTKALDAMTGGKAYTQEDIDAAARVAVAKEQARQADIREAVKLTSLPETFAEDLIKRNLSADAARKEIFAKMREVNPPIGAGGIVAGADEKDKFRKAVVDGIGQRCGLRPDKPAPGSENFRAATIEHIARLCLERAGVDTRSMASRNQVANAIMRQAAAGNFTTDDFTSIFMDVANKTLQRAYTESPATWRPWVNVVSASDFKTIYGVSLSEAPDLQMVSESGEYKSGEMTDNRESYRIYTFGKIIYLTRTMIVNDDLRAFTRLPALMGAAARRNESDLVYGLLLSNPAMNDGNDLFSAAHANIEATAAMIAPVNLDNLSSGRTGMRMQTAPGGSHLDLRPRFVLIPVAQETNAEIILRSTALPDADMSSGVYNPWAGKLIPIAEPRLDDSSTTAWYLIADPSQIDTIEVAYLDGNEMPYTEEQALFERDAIGYKIRHDFGCGVMDFRGMWLNEGESGS